MKSTKNNIAALSVFTNVQEFIALTNVSPLLSSSVKVNKDQVNELGDAVDQEFPFASIDTGFAESNDGLLFALYFYETGVSVGYSGGENSWIDYGELGSTSKNVSAQLIKLLTIFANGQLKVLLTCLDDGAFFTETETKKRCTHNVIVCKHCSNRRSYDRCYENAETTLS